MANSQIIYIKKYNVFVRQDWWLEAKQKAKMKAGLIPIRDPEEVKIFEADLARRPIVNS